jgi:hypothetical protein
MPFRSELAELAELALAALFHCCCLLLNPDCYFFSRKIQSAGFDQQAAWKFGPVW